jgi:hypothetical protein
MILSPKKHDIMKRRQFIRKSSLFAGTLAAFSFSSANHSSHPTFLIVSGWQPVNIGDIAHTPGIISLIYRFFPKAKCILWPKFIDHKIEKMLLQNFPDLEVFYFNTKSNDPGENDHFNRVVEESDMLIHSSGPGLIGINQLILWKNRTRKPYGIVGITLERIVEDQREVLRDAAFVFTRETISLKLLENENFKNVITGFVPDSTFAISLSDDKKANKFMHRHQLQEKNFICVISRLRYTPYHLFYLDIGWSDEKIREVTEINDRHKEEDHAKLRDLISWWIRESGNKVVACPEMTYQVNIMDPLIIDPLPDEYKDKMVKHDYWLPDEAASLYKKAFAVISMECHSPIIAAANETPCFYLRQPQDTIKGQMWYDLGLENWVFEIEETTSETLIRRFEDVYNHYRDATEYLRQSMIKTDRLYLDTFRQIQEFL